VGRGVVPDEEYCFPWFEMPAWSAICHIRRWTMDDGRWTMDDGRWTMDDGRWTMDDGRWTVRAYGPSSIVPLLDVACEVRLHNGAVRRRVTDQEEGQPGVVLRHGRADGELPLFGRGAVGRPLGAGNSKAEHLAGVHLELH